MLKNDFNVNTVIILLNGLCLHLSNCRQVFCAMVIFNISQNSKTFIDICTHPILIIYLLSIQYFRNEMVFATTPVFDVYDELTTIEFTTKKLKQIFTINVYYLMNILYFFNKMIIDSRN